MESSKLTTPTKRRSTPRHLDEHGLLPKQRLFADTCLSGVDAKNAYIQVYKSSGNVAGVNACRLLQTDAVEKYMTEKRKKLQKKCDITAEYVLSTIRETIERCKQALPVLDAKGRPVMVQVRDGEDNFSMAPCYAFDSKGVLKGAELLGKHLKLFTERVEHTGNVVVVADINDEKI